jgi:glycosyltransferase involved in cell wall biosynthesis
MDSYGTKMNKKSMPDKEKEHLKVSIVVGNHSQRYDVLHKYAIASILNSDYPLEKIEIIIVDNNCDKVSLTILQEMFCKIGNIKIIRESQQGTCFMRNRGLSVTSGEIIAFIDDDCEVDRNWLKRMVNFYSDPIISFGGGSVFDVKLNRYVRSEVNLKWRQDLHVIGGNMSFRKEILLENQFDTNLIYDNDEFELISRLLLQNYKYYFDLMAIKHYRANSLYRKVANCKETFTSRGENESKFGKYYYKLKKRIFERNYLVNNNTMFRLLITELKAFLNFEEAHYKKSLIQEVYQKSFFDILLHGPRKVCLTGILASIQVYKNLQRLKKFKQS